jgi:hypothetical protein
MQEFQVFTVAIVKNSVFLDITPFSLVKVNRFVALLTTQFHAGFLLGLFFYPEDEGEIFLRNVSLLSMDYTASYPRKHNPSTKRGIVGLIPDYTGTFREPVNTTASCC